VAALGQLLASVHLPPITGTHSRASHCPSPRPRRLARHKHTQVPAPSAPHAQHRGPCSTIPPCFVLGPKVVWLISCQGQDTSQAPRIRAFCMCRFSELSRAGRRGVGACTHTNAGMQREADEPQSAVAAALGALPRTPGPSRGPPQHVPPARHPPPPWLQRAAPRATLPSPPAPRGYAGNTGTRA